MAASLLRDGPGPSYNAAALSDFPPKHELRQNSAVLTSGIIIADVVGAGILSIAVAIKQFGWMLGAVLVLALLVMNAHVAILLWRCCMGNPEARTLAGLAKAVGAGSYAQDATLLVQYVYIFSMLALYVLTIGKGLGMLFYDIYICLPMWAFIGCCLVFPFFATGRTLGAWDFLIWCNIITVCLAIAIPIIDLVTAGVETTRPEDAQMVAFTCGDTLMGLSLMTFAFTSQFMIVEIVSEMRHPEEFPKAYIWYSAPFQGAAFLVVGLLGYYFKGDSAEGMIGDTIEFGVFFRLSAACIVIHIVVTFMIKAVVLGRGLHEYFSPRTIDDDSISSWIMWTVITVGILGSAWFVSQIVPFFADFVELIGASLSPLGCYIIPIFLYLLWLRDSAPESAALGMPEKLVIAFEIVFAFVLMVMGTRASAGRIMSAWSTYGYPFDCHCDDLWNTCNCSAAHSGMENCPGVAA